MHTLRTAVVGLTIFAIVFTLLYPPWGYTKSTVLTIFKDSPGGSETRTDSDPWTYARHSFLFSSPPRDPKNQQRIKAMNADNPEARQIVLSYDDMKVAWNLVAVQAIIIVLVGAGILFALRKP